MTGRSDVINTGRLAKILLIGICASVVVGFLVLGSDEIRRRAFTCDRTATTDGCRRTTDRIARRACDRSEGFIWQNQVQVKVLHYSSDAAGVPYAKVTTYWCEDF